MSRSVEGRAGIFFSKGKDGCYEITSADQGELIDFDQIVAEDQVTGRLNGAEPSGYRDQEFGYTNDGTRVTLSRSERKAKSEYWLRDDNTL